MRYFKNILWGCAGMIVLALMFLAVLAILAVVDPQAFNESITETEKLENIDRINECDIDSKQVSAELSALLGLDSVTLFHFSDSQTETTPHEDNQDQFAFVSDFASDTTRGTAYGALDVSDCRILLHRVERGITDLQTIGTPDPTKTPTPTPTLTQERQILKDCDLDPDTPIEKREDGLGAIYVVTLGDRCIALDTRACMAMGEVPCR